MFRAHSTFVHVFMLAASLLWFNRETRAARLTGSFSPIASGSNVNLSIVGGLDWVHWGHGSVTEINRKASVTPRISLLVGVGANPIQQLTTNHVGFGWGDGTPVLAVSNSPTGLFVQGLTNGFEITVAADTERRRLQIFAGAEAATGLLEALLSDASAPGYFDESLASVALTSNGVFVIDYAAASSGQTLTVRFTAQSVIDEAFGRILIAAAALASNLPPAVQMIFPTNNARFFQSAPVSLAASASDADGTIQKVEFYRGATKLGEVLDPPYTIQWDSVPPGNYILTARAFDDDGAFSVSAPVAVVVLTNSAPTVAITNPVNFADFPVPSSVVIKAAASDTDGSVTNVEFFANAAKLGEVANSPYELMWTNAPVGEYQITARATDNNGATSVSPAVDIFVTQSGGYLIASPATVTDPVLLDAEGPADWAHWGLYSENSLNRKRGVASQISNYTIIGGGTVYPYSDNANPYSWVDGTPTAAVTNTTTGVYIVGLQNGFRIQAPAGPTTNTLKVYVGAYAARGRLLAYLSDLSAPVASDFSVNNPGNGPNTVYTFQFASASAGKILNVLYFAEALHSGDGNVTLQAAALDTGNLPPSATVTNPVRGATLLWPTNITISVEAADADGSVTNVEFFRNSVKLGQKTDSPYTLVWSDATLGSHRLSARATDDKGVTFTSQAVDVFVGVGGGSLAASSAFPSAQVDLAAEGFVDWTHWGLSTANSFNHRNGATTRISNATRIGGGQTRRYTDNFSGFSWTNGTPTSSASSTTTGIYASGLANGFQITAPADASPRRLKVYVGLFATRARFEAYLTDNSARPFVDTSLMSIYGNNYRVYTIDYHSATPGQQLVVRQTAEESFDLQYGNVTLQSATLVDLPSLLLSNFVWDGSAMRFSFATRSLKSYLVQSSEILPGTNWITFEAFPGTGLEVWITNSPPASAQHFYRVVEY